MLPPHTHTPGKDKRNQEQSNVGLDNNILRIWKVASIKTLWDVLNLFQTKIFMDWLPIRLSLLSSFFIELSQEDSSCSANHGRFLKNPGEERDWYINLIHADENPSSGSTDNSCPQTQCLLRDTLRPNKRQIPPNIKRISHKKKALSLDHKTLTRLKNNFPTDANGKKREMEIVFLVI